MQYRLALLLKSILLIKCYLKSCIPLRPVIPPLQRRSEKFTPFTNISCYFFLKLFYCFYFGTTWKNYVWDSSQKFAAHFWSGLCCICSSSLNIYSASKKTFSRQKHLSLTIKTNETVLIVWQCLFWCLETLWLSSWSSWFL